MKPRLLRILAVGAAMAIPAGGLTLLSTGTAGATTGTVSVHATLGTIGSLTCPTQALAPSSPGTTIGPCTTSGDIGDFGTVHGILNGINGMSLANGVLPGTDQTEIYLYSTSLACTVSFLTTIPLMTGAPVTETYMATIHLTETVNYTVTPSTTSLCAALGGAITGETVVLSITT